MSAFTLTFRVDAPSEPGDATPALFSPASQKLRRELYQLLGLKVRSVAWASIAVDSPKGRQVLQTLGARRAGGGAVIGSATLTETIDAGDVAQAGWFYLSTRTVDDFNLWDDYPGCKAGSLPDAHALNHTFVSSAFVSACTRLKLEGIGFLRCASRGRKPARPWFVALPDAPLGRGLDHPWFDRARWLRDVAARPDRRSSSIDVGQSAFHQCWLRDAAILDAPLSAVLRVCPMPPAFTTGIDGLQIVTIPRFWSPALPAADFAYVPWGENGPNREGKMMRFRMLAVSARARQALLDEGLFDDKAFLAVRSVDAPEPGVATLDRAADPIPPMYPAADLAALRAREAALPRYPKAIDL